MADAGRSCQQSLINRVAGINPALPFPRSQIERDRRVAFLRALRELQPVGLFR
jgi:hypothetical protein